jgi:radical SAM superfamily enzyme YgiQ (UPF0313 family)
MVGLPGQSVDGIRESIQIVRRLGARARLAYFSPVPGTAAYQDLVAKGILRRDSDPLLHNKLAFPYIWGEISPADFVSFKELAHPQREFQKNNQ